MPDLPHLHPENTTNKEPYQTPRSGGPSLVLPARERATHGAALQNQLQQVQPIPTAPERGVILQFESEPGFKLQLNSLESRNQGIELLSVRDIEQREFATVRVPSGKLQHFTKLVGDYLGKTTKKGQPKNRNAVESISRIQSAALESFWTDDPESWPAENMAPIWWEVWLRAGESVLAEFIEGIAHINAIVSDRAIHFPDRTVVLVRCSKNALATSPDLLGWMAELRKPKELASFFTNLPPAETMAWALELVGRLNPPNGDANAVCLLDTGVNREHPLLAPALAAGDMFTYDPAWGEHDHLGHGTQMAGLALYGDLINPLSTADPVNLGHRLESVKILPPENNNPPHLYGAITLESVARPEVESPTRKRVICLTVTTTDFRDRGRPSSWSAEIDALASGANDDRQRLFVISAGNVARDDWTNYPDSNQTELIHDPAQAWNALSVGAYTGKIEFDERGFEDWTLIAASGDMSPCHSTSLTWDRAWPIKPDVVMEGGNALKSPLGQVDQVDSLLLLTTHHQPLIRAFTTTGETSAAAAQVSRLAARIQVEYPDLWPETIRALIVHSADWTDAMIQRFITTGSRDEYRQLLRCYGHGVPNENRAIWSQYDAMTMTIQGELQPFTRKKSTSGATKYSLNEMDVHALPWPTEVLAELGEVEVELRVTLSYFIEPSPSRRGWKNRYRYASHGLRFDVKTPTETLEAFRKRLNKAAREEEAEGPITASDSAAWRLGPGLRSLGSVHSDRWTGTAAALAARGYIGVFPVVGWWRERHQLGRWDRSARYALVVSISTPGTAVDIYTPVATQIQVPTQIPI
jgi:hypothetical protein